MANLKPGPSGEIIFFIFLTRIVIFIRSFQHICAVSWNKRRPPLAKSQILSNCQFTSCRWISNGMQMDLSPI